MKNGGRIGMKKWGRNGMKNRGRNGMKNWGRNGMKNGGGKCIRNRVLKRGSDWLFRIHFLPQQVGRKTGKKLNPKTGKLLVQKRG